jgi:hypothetical protein
MRHQYASETTIARRVERGRPRDATGRGDAGYDSAMPIPKELLLAGVLVGAATPACSSAVGADGGIDAATGGDARADGGGLDTGTADAGDAACGFFATIARSCTGDAACAAAFHQTNCCGTLVAVGISESDRARFDMLEPACRASYPGCGCPSGLTETDSHETVTDPAMVRVACVTNGPSRVCMTYVNTRPPDSP